MDMDVDLAELDDLTKKYGKINRKMKRKLRQLARESEENIWWAVLEQMGGPGPNIQTGAYVGAFKAEATSSQNAFTLTLSNSSPQTARLEYGFYGTDVLGRNYSDPPRPHMRPALIKTQQWYMEEAAAIIEDLLR